MHAHTSGKPATLVATPEPHKTAEKPARDLVKFVVPVVVFGVVSVMVGVSSIRWDRWTAGADIQTTDNAYIRSELSRLSARVSGNIIAVEVQDFDHVRAGDVIVRIDPSDYEARRDQAKAALASAKAKLRNIDNQSQLQDAAIRQAEAEVSVADANAVLARTEAERQETLISKGAGIQQKKDEADAKMRTTAASVGAMKAAVASAKAQLEFIAGQREQFEADVASARATLKSAELNLSYTNVVAPFDGIVSEKQVHVGDYVTAGTSTIAIVPLPNVYVIANFKETQLSRMREGQPVEVSVDSFPDEKYRAKVTRLSPASGSQYALLPADNATGNFTKVVQRIPVRIDFEPSPAIGRLRAGTSAVVSVSVAAQE